MENSNFTFAFWIEKIALWRLIRILLFSGGWNQMVITPDGLFLNGEIIAERKHNGFYAEITCTAIQEEKQVS